MRKRNNKRSDDERFLEITSQLSDLDGLDKGPRDYSLAEPDDRFVPPPPEPISHQPWIFLAVAAWVLIVAIPIVLWFMNLHFTAMTGFFYAILVGIGVIALFAALRPHRPSDDDGATV